MVKLQRTMFLIDYYDILMIHLINIIQVKTLKKKIFNFQHKRKQNIF